MVDPIPAVAHNRDLSGPCLVIARLPQTRADIGLSGADRAAFGRGEIAGGSSLGVRSGGLEVDSGWPDGVQG